MPPEMITRAFLASAGMERIRSARVIESKHTGRWRYAHAWSFSSFWTDTRHPARQALGTSRTERNKTWITGATDRNAFLYAMLEVEISMGIGRDSSRLDGDADRYRSFTALEMYDEICGYGNADADGPAGWRVAYQRYSRNFNIIDVGPRTFDRKPMVRRATSTGASTRTPIRLERQTSHRSRQSSGTGRWRCYNP